MSWKILRELFTNTFHTLFTLNPHQTTSKNHISFSKTHIQKRFANPYISISSTIYKKITSFYSVSRQPKKGSNQEKTERERERERFLTYDRGLRRPQEFREHEFLIWQLENDGYGSWVRMRTELGNFFGILFFIFKIIAYLYGLGWIIPVDKWAFDMCHYQVKLGISLLSFRSKKKKKKKKKKKLGILVSLINVLPIYKKGKLQFTHLWFGPF